MSDSRPTKHQFLPAGCSTSFELAIRFTDWAADLNALPTQQQIADHWQVSRATSYRWLRAYQDARAKTEAAAA